MEFRILGPVEVEVDGTPVTIAPKERVLPAVLVVSAGEVVSVQRLIHELWGSDPPADARNAVQLLVSRLRKALGPHGRQLLVTQRPGYVLQVRSELSQLAAVPRSYPAGRPSSRRGRRCGRRVPAHGSDAGGGLTSDRRP